MNCVMCGEEIRSLAYTNMIDGQDAHNICLLRSSVGGIGHLLAHEHWCLEKGDPDAGLTYHQSAVLVSTLVDLLGVEAVVRLDRDPAERGERQAESDEGDG